MLSKWPRASATPGVSRNAATRITASVAATGASALPLKLSRDHQGSAWRSAIRARTAGHISRPGRSRRSPISESVRSSSRSSIRSDMDARLACGDLAQARDRPREPRLHGAAGNAEGVGHLGLRELHEVPVSDDQSILLAKLAERAKHERTPLARQGRLLGRQGRVTRGAILDDAEVDRRSPAGRLAAGLSPPRAAPGPPGGGGGPPPRGAPRERRPW